MGGLYGSPRILQCIANENVIPIIKVLGHGVSSCKCQRSRGHGVRMGRGQRSMRVGGMGSAYEDYWGEESVKSLLLKAKKMAF